MTTDVLKITINNHNSVELSSLVDMMGGVAYLYKNLIKSNVAYKNLETKLFIDKVTKGSIIVDLVCGLQALGGDLSPLFEYVKWLKSIMDFFLDKDIQDPDLALQEATAVKHLINITSNDIGGNLNISIDKLEININSLESKAMDHNLDKYIENKFKNTQATIYNKLPMRWDASNFGDAKQDGKIIIESIDLKPKYVIFVDDVDKIKCTTHNAKYPKLQWQELIYHVDVEVIYIANKLREYKILKVYDEVIPLDDEE